MKKMLLTTKDNSRIVLDEIDPACLNDLKVLAKYPISKLRFDDNPNLLIFPQDFDSWGDKIGEQHIFSIEGNDLATGNIMGFVGLHDIKVSISSRFSQSDNNDYFLHYILQKVLAINLFDLKFDSALESIFDFLIYLFPAYLKRAMRQGIYKEYQTRRYNDANIRGRVDITRHIRVNNPFAGRIAYSTREYATDNHLTQLIRHTIEYIESHRYGNNILQQDQETTDAVKAIQEATPSYVLQDRSYVIGKNLRSVSHPYYLEYRPLQKLCLQILRHEELKYGRDKQEIYGVLFDGAWLWEEYLNTFLYPVLLHPRNKTKEGRIWLFQNHAGECYPDFYNKERGIVLDAKYKGYDSWGSVQNADLYQVISYMQVLDANRGGFLVPTKKVQLTHRILNGTGRKMMSILGMKVDVEESNFGEFCQHMAVQELTLIERVKQFVETVI